MCFKNVYEYFERIIIFNYSTVVILLQNDIWAVFIRIKILDVKHFTQGSVMKLNLTNHWFPDMKIFKYCKKIKVLLLWLNISLPNTEWGISKRFVGNQFLYEKINEVKFSAEWVMNIKYEEEYYEYEYKIILGCNDCETGSFLNIYLRKCND